MTNRLITQVAIVSLFIFCAAFFKPAKADFSGSWKVNEEKTIYSKTFSKNSVPISMKVSQNKKSISIERTSNNRLGEIHAYSETLPFDGTIVNLMNRTTHKTTSGQWSSDGNSFLETSNYSDSTAPPQYAQYKATEIWNLSGDRKILTIDRIENIDNMNDTTKMVYDKE